MFSNLIEKHMPTKAPKSLQTERAQAYTVAKETLTVDLPHRWEIVRQLHLSGDERRAEVGKVADRVAAGLEKAARLQSEGIYTLTPETRAITGGVELLGGMHGWPIYVARTALPTGAMVSIIDGPFTMQAYITEAAAVYAGL